MHLASSVVSFRDYSLKIKILYGMVLRMDGQTFIGGVHGGSLRNSPTLENPLHLQPQIVMETPCLMPLYHKPQGSLVPVITSFWFRSLGKVSFLVVLL